MKNKLLLSTAVAFVCMIGAPSLLFACASDEPLPMAPSQRVERSPQDWWDFLQDPASSPSMDDYARAARCFHASPEHLSKEAYALFAYIKDIQLPSDGSALPQITLDLLKHAAGIFSALSLDEQLSYVGTYFGATYTLLTSDRSLSCTDILSLLDRYLHFSFDEGIALASTRYITHPDAAKTHRTHPFLAAHAYDRATKKDKNKSLILFGLALDQNPEKFTYEDLCHVQDLFCKASQYPNAAKAARLLMAKEGDRYRFHDITPNDLLNCAGSFSVNKDIPEALKTLQDYYALETTHPHRSSYNLTASCYMYLSDFERACEYWDLAIKAGVTLNCIQYRNIAYAFRGIGNLTRAALYLEKSLAFPEAKKHFKILFEASETFLGLHQFERANECAQMCLSLLDEAPDEAYRTHALLNAASALSHLEENEKAALYWRQVIDKKDVSGEHLFNAGFTFYKMGDLETASACFAKSAKQNAQVIASSPYSLAMIFLCHIDAGQKDHAHDLWIRYKDHFAHLFPMLKIPQPKKMPQRKQTKAPSHAKAPILSPELSFDHGVLASLRATLAQNIVNDIHKETERVKNASHEGLATLREKILSLVTQAEGLKGSLRASHASTSSASSSSASSSSSSSSSSEPTLAPHDDAKTRLFQLRRLKGHIQSLTRDFDKKQSKIMTDDRKRAMKEWIALSAAEPSQLYVASPITPKKGKTPGIRTPKTKTRGTASQSTGATSSSTSSSASSAASASSSSSSAPAPTVTNVEWRITPTAQKQLKTLKTVRGLQGKFDTFRHEIEMEPWGRRGQAATHASGRAKRLKGYENVFSRRFAKGERFFYRVEYAANGRVIVTILGLMEHDL